jgi:hypothetical protein
MVISSLKPFSLVLRRFVPLIAMNFSWSAISIWSMGRVAMDEEARRDKADNLRFQARSGVHGLTSKFWSNPIFQGVNSSDFSFQRRCANVMAIRPEKLMENTGPGLMAGKVVLAVELRERKDLLDTTLGSPDPEG